MNLITAQIGAWFYVLTDDSSPDLYVPVMIYGTPEEATAYVAQFGPPPADPEAEGAQQPEVVAG